MYHNKKSFIEKQADAFVGKYKNRGKAYNDFVKSIEQFLTNDFDYLDVKPTGAKLKGKEILVKALTFKTDKEDYLDDEGNLIDIVISTDPFYFLNGKFSWNPQNDDMQYLNKFRNILRDVVLVWLGEKDRVSPLYNNKTDQEIVSFGINNYLRNVLIGFANLIKEPKTDLKQNDASYNLFSKLLK